MPMVMDALVLAIFVLSIFLAMHRGFALTVISFVRVIASLVLGFLFCDDLRDFLLATTVGDWFTEKIEDNLTDSLSAAWADSPVQQMLPAILQKQTDQLADTFTETTLNSLTNLLLTILSFFLIVLGVSVVCLLLRHLFSKQYNDGFIGFMDWLLGGLMGIVCGLFAVFLFLALLPSLAATFAPELAEKITASLAASHFAGDLYDNNLLCIFW